MSEYCVCCGAEIPEGRMVCPNCESQYTNRNASGNKSSAAQKEGGERMPKEFPVYSILDIESALEIPHGKSFKYKPIIRKDKAVRMFTKKSFERYSNENDVHVIGNIHRRQRHYKECSGENEIPEKKLKKHIIARANLHDERKDLNRSYDVREPYRMYTVGFAYVGDGAFLRVVTFNPLFVLLPLLVCVLILAFGPCKPELPTDSFKWANGTEVSDNKPQSDAEQPDLCYFEPFPEKTTLTDENRCIALKNIPDNKGKYLVSYRVLVNGKEFYNTGAIKPSNMVEYDLWTQLDIGSYDLCCQSTEYDIQTLEQMDGHYNLTTELIIKK